MSGVNEAYLLEQFRFMEDYLGRGRRLAAKPKTEFLSDPISIDAAVREITVLFETAHNIAKHLIARNDWRSAQSKRKPSKFWQSNPYCRTIWWAHSKRLRGFAIS